MVTMEEVTGSRSIRVCFDVLEWPWKAECERSEFSDRSL